MLQHCRITWSNVVGQRGRTLPNTSSAIAKTHGRQLPPNTWSAIATKHRPTLIATKHCQLQEGSLLRKLHVGTCPRTSLTKQKGLGGFVGARSGSFFVEILMSDLFFGNFEFRDRYGDVGHHLLVQDAPSFIQKHLLLIICWRFFAFVCISDKCTFFIDFHVLALPGSSRPPQKISTDSPDFEFSYYNLMPFIYGQMSFLGTPTTLAPRNFLDNTSENRPVRIHFCLTKDFLR
jgi:hypothetical protein